VGESAAYVLDRKDRVVRVGTQQAITREVEALERNARPRACFDVAVEDLALLFQAALRRGFSG